MLQIRHRLESEIVDAASGITDWVAIEKLVDAVVPKVGHAILLSGTGGAPIVDIDERFGNVVVNLNPQIIEKVEGVVAREIRGDQHIGDSAVELLTLIKEYGGQESQDLVSSVYELEDTSAPKSGRLGAKQKLRKFLVQLGSRGCDVAVGLLQAYVEKKLGF